MNIVYLRYLTLIVLLNIKAYSMELHPEIVACNLDLISQNKSAADITNSIWTNACLLWKLGRHALSLRTHTDAIRQWGEEIAKTTHGKGWVTKELAAMIKDRLCIEISDGAIQAMIDVGTDPVANIPAITAVKEIAKRYQIIGFANQDRLEYEVYQKKISRSVNLNQLCAAVVAISSYVDTPPPVVTKGYFRYSDSKPLYLSIEAYPAATFTNAIYNAANSLGYSDRQEIPIITTQEELKAIAYPGR